MTDVICTLQQFCVSHFRMFLKVCVWTDDFFLIGNILASLSCEIQSERLMSSAYCSSFAFLVYVLIYHFFSQG